ncbi:MAG: hypothetical protein Q8R98_12085 [Rubrivivax sp.]|nr:hypothetical protein [Rubrivivax sp.]MDP3612585.1 hypothetical protein [Rubrivivax sp.]
MKLNSLQIQVRDRNQAFTTSRIRGMSCSSTSSAELAARRLAEKLFGSALQEVQLQAQLGVHSTFLATADANIKAWCFACGTIGFGTEEPDGAVVFATGPDRALREVVEVAARHAKPRSSGTLLVPGVPEAPNQEAGMTALMDWVAWRAPRNGQRGSFGVVFGPLPRS